MVRIEFIVADCNRAAPEQLRGEASTSKSDVFSFGVTIWEVLLSPQKLF